MGKPLTYDHLRGKKQPLKRSVRIPMDSDIADAYEEASNRLEFAKLVAAAKPEDIAAMAEIDQATEAYRQAKDSVTANSVLFTFRAIGRSKYEKLKLEHPRTSKQKVEDEKEGRDPSAIAWNHDTFPPALIAAACVSPQLSEEDVQDMWESDNWSEAELALLFGTAIDANQAHRVVDLGKG